MTYQETAPEASLEVPRHDIPNGRVNGSNGDIAATKTHESLSEIARYIEEFDITKQVDLLVPDAPAYRTVLRQIADFVDTNDGNLKSNSKKTVDKYLQQGFYEIYDEENAQRELLFADGIVGQIVCIKELVDINRAQLGFMQNADRVKPLSRYRLLKAINVFDGEDSSAGRGTLWMFAIDRIDKNENDALVREIQSELEEGKYDDCVASDLIKEASDPDITTKRAKELEPISRFVNFLNGIFPNDVDEVAINTKLFSREVMQDWPRDVLALVEKQRKEMLETTEEKIDEYVFRLKSKGLVSLPKDEKNLNGNINAYFRELKKSVAQNGMPKTLKRKRLSLISKRVEMQPVTENQAEDEPPENSIKVYSPSGDPLEIDEDRLVEIAEKDGFDIKDKNLESDVRNIFKYLVTANKALPAESGLKKLSKFRDKENGRVFWEFKPSEAKGLPTTTKLTNYLRIIVSLCDDGFVVHKIVRRDQLDRGIKAVAEGLRLH